jgi:thiamine pyrophosphate-dependent acetolactate synthase large subunit-like protein
MPVVADLGQALNQLCEASDEVTPHATPGARRKPGHPFWDALDASGHVLVVEDRHIQSRAAVDFAASTPSRWIAAGSVGGHGWTIAVGLGVACASQRHVACLLHPAQMLSNLPHLVQAPGEVELKVVILSAPFTLLADAGIRSFARRLGWAFDEVGNDPVMLRECLLAPGRRLIEWVGAI